MMDKKNSVSGTETLDKTKKNTINTSIIPHPRDKKHLVYFDASSYKQQPTGKEMAYITNRFKYGVMAQHLTLEDILKRASNGRSFLPYNYETINDKIVFLGSSIAFVDVDDNDMLFDVQDVLKALGTNVGGLFYTFSHGTKGNRYRLAFELDRTVTNEKEYKSILKYFAAFLKSKGIPADEKPTLQPIRGGIQGYELVESHTPFSVDKLLAHIKPMEEAEQREKQHFLIVDNNEYEAIPFEALQEMAESIGIISTGDGRGQEWVRLSYALKSYVQQGHITDEQGLELLCMISGETRQAENQWTSNKPNGEANIGSFIKSAQQNGYKGKTYRKQYEDVKTDYSNVIKVDRYIPSEVSKMIIGKRKRILVESPTGSGKSVSFTKTFAELETLYINAINIIVTPTIPLARQLSKNTNYMCIQGKTPGLHKRVKAYIDEGNRNFVATYDKAPQLIQAIEKRFGDDFQFNLVIDEYHRLVIDFSSNFRREQIKNLKALGEMDQCISYIGLSGTVDDINKDDFNEIYRIDNGLPGSPNKEFKVYSSVGKGLFAQLISLVENRVNDGYKLLVFVQSLKKIDEMKTLLRRSGINVRTVTADDKLNNPTFQDIVNHERVADDVQVILASPVIADGVSIQNKPGDKWEIIATCTNFSPIFNPSVIKQMSNRLRNEYDRFSIFINGSDKEREGLYNTDGRYKYKLRQANKFVEEMSNHIHFNADAFHRSMVESAYGIRLENGGLIVDHDDLRHIVVRDKETYYKYRVNDFIQAVEEIMCMKQIETVQLSECVDDIESILKSLRAAESADISTIFTKEVYQGVKIGHPEILKAFKDAVDENKYATALDVVQYADYETSKTIIGQIKSRNKIHAFSKDLHRLYELDKFNHEEYKWNTTKTSQVIAYTYTLINGGMNKLDDIVELVRNKTGVDRQEIIKTINSFFITESKRVKDESKKDDKEKRLRVKFVKCIKSLEVIAELYGLTIEQVQAAYDEYVKVNGLTIDMQADNDVKYIPLEFPFVVDYSQVYQVPDIQNDSSVFVDSYCSNL